MATSTATTTGTGTGTVTGTVTGTGTGTGTGTSTVVPSSTVTAPASFGSYDFLSCYGNSNGYSSFTLALSDASMTLEECVSTCSGMAMAYAGVYYT